MLDAGVYNSEVRDALRAGAPLRLASDTELSTALSRALLTLNRRNLIELENRGDAAKLLLVCPDTRPVTHVALGVAG